MTQREAFEAWWEEFSSAHEDWRFADSDALRWATWRAAKQARPEPSDDYLGKAYRLAKELFDHLAVAPAQPERAPLSADAYEALVDDLGEWSRYVVEDTAHITLDTHIRRTLAVHGIKQGGQQ